jgi:hypothetical protein
MMLQSNAYSKDTIVSFKLVNGDEIVAKVLEETADSFTVAKPCTVVPSQQGLGLLQSLFTSDLTKNIALSKNHVMLHSVTQKDIENHYIQTTTGIEPVGNKGIIV